VLRLRSEASLPRLRPRAMTVPAGAHLGRRAARAPLAIVALTLATTSMACQDTTLDLFDPELGLIAHWALDEEDAAAQLADTSGFGHPGTPSTNPPTTTTDVPPVHFANARSRLFNGQDQWISLGNPDLLSISGPITVAAWIRPGNNTGLFHDIVAHGFHSLPDQEVALRIGSENYQFIGWDGVDHKAEAPIPASDAGTWVHLCGVFEGQGYRLYRNGALLASADDTTLPPRVDASWAIGARAESPTDVASRLFQGEIDDVRVYGRALAAGEVEALYRR